jgi:hypothetical protein
MGFTSGFLDQIRSEIAPSDDVLAETRYRLNLVRRAGEDFPHALRTYTSGSIAHHTANNPVSDGCWPSFRVPMTASFAVPM